jgi:hypothetical protein
MSYRLRKVKDGVEFTYPLCTHFAKKPLNKAAKLSDEEGNSLTGGRTGLEIEMTFDGNTREVIFLPDEADVVYVMNAGGDTIDTIRSPATPR